MTTHQAYATWDARLQGRNSTQRKVANNTYLIRQGSSSIGLKLHATTIITVRPDGRITLDSGGWRTPTTKGRMNDALRELLPTSWPGIYQQSGIWLIYPHGKHDQALTFADGMWVLPDGSLAGGGPDISVLKEGVKLIRAYMKPVPQMLASGTFPRPGPGDPWNFLMAAEDGTLPLAGKDAETRKHLVQYMKSKYYFGSLMLRAMEKKLGVKHGDTKTLHGMVCGTIPRSEWRGFVSLSPACLHCFAAYMNGSGLDGLFASIGAKQLAGVLDAYLKHWFNLAPN